MRLLLVLFFMVTTYLSAQVEGVWQNYTNMSDIVQMDIRNNILWAGTSGGVFSYDFETGEYTKYTKSEGLSSQNISAIEIHPDGNIWIGSLEGYIDVINPSENSIKYITDIARTNQSSKQINDFLIKGDSIYVATDFGISLLNTSTLLFVETYTKLGELVSNSRIFRLYYDETLFAIGETGVATLKADAINPVSPEAWQNKMLPSGASFFKFSKRAAFQGETYFGTTNGLYRENGTTFTFVTFSESNVYDLEIIENRLVVITQNSVSSFTTSGTNTEFSTTDYNFKGIYKANSYYLMTSRGITSYPVDDNPQFIAPDGPSLNSFADLIIDENGELWAGSGRASLIGGIYNFNGSNWTNYNHFNTASIKFDGFHRLYKGKDGVLYFANWGAGFSTYIDGEIESFYPPEFPVTGISVNPNFLVVWNLEEDSDDNLWLLNYEASDRNVLSVKRNDSTWTHFRMASPLAPVVANAEHFAIDRNDTKWFGVTSTGGNGPGLYYFNENGTLDDLEDDVWGIIKATDGLTSSEITDINIDNRGEIWVGTTEGITVIVDPANPTSRMQSVFPLRTQSITCIAVDPINRKWIGTTQGVFLLSSDGTELIENYTKDNSPIPTNIINAIVIDPESGTAYVGTDFGLSTLTTLSVLPETSAGDLEIFPNPFIVGEHDNIYIDKLVKETSIKILSIDGRLIKEMESPGGRIARWDGKDQNGNYVGSGIYIVVAYDTEADNVQLGKIAVVRK